MICCVHTIDFVLLCNQLDDVNYYNFYYCTYITVLVRFYSFLFNNYNIVCWGSLGYGRTVGRPWGILIGQKKKKKSMSNTMVRCDFTCRLRFAYFWIEVHSKCCMHHAENLNHIFHTIR